MAAVSRAFRAGAAAPQASAERAPADAAFRWGRLEARERLGRGAFGEVWRAWDPALEREVALKLARHDGRDRARWLDEASAEPTTVGAMWFQYRDEPLSGRGPGQGAEAVYGEHYAFGTTDDTDRPKYDLVTRMRVANIAAGRRRLGLTDPAGPGSGRKRVLAVDAAPDERGNGSGSHGNHSE